MNSRALAAAILNTVIKDGKKLDEKLKTITQDKAFIQTLFYGVCRYYFRLNKCIKQARRAGHILHTLKDMLCYRNHHPELTSINALIENTVAILAEKIKETEAKLELHFDNNLSDIQCDRIQIELVIINLIKNACEAIVQQRINDKEKCDKNYR